MLDRLAVGDVAGDRPPLPELREVDRDPGDPRALPAPQPGRARSLAITSDPARLESTLIGLAYPASKAAVNMLTSQYAKALPNMRVNAVDPGYTATDFNGHRGHKTVEQGAEVIVRMALLDASGPTGTYVDDQGPLPW